MLTPPPHPLSAASRLILGLCIGLGAAFILAALLFTLCVKQAKSATVSAASAKEPVAEGSKNSP